MSVNRRNLLIGGLGSALVGGGTLYGLNQTTLFDAVKPIGREHLLICDTPINKPTVINGITMTKPGCVRGLVVATGETFKIDLPFFGHTLTQRPHHPHQMVVMEKWGQRAALIDVVSREVKQTFKTEGTNLFFGHAAFDPLGHVLVSSEDTYDRDQGQLIVRAPDTGKIVSRIASGGTNPHECRASADGRHIIVVNEGRGAIPSNLAWVELASGKLVHKVELPLTFGHCSHVNLSQEGWAVLGGKGRKDVPGEEAAPIVILSPQGQLSKPRLPTEIKALLLDEALSIAFVDGTDFVGVTVPASNMILLINYKTGELIKTLEEDEPKGIITGKEPRSFIVTSARHRGISKVELHSNGEPPLVQVLNAGFGGIGSHMVRVLV